MELSVDRISVRLSGKEILKSVSFSVEDGAFVSLLGASGCGKSTLLKTIAGIIPQQSGSVLLGGSNADALPVHRRGTVIVFQDFRLFPHMTTAENISFPLKMKGIPKKEALKKASALLEKVQLRGFDKRKPHELSGGQLQRVALARALAAEPTVLLLDEPFSSLDENLRQEMRDLVMSLHREYRTTTVLVTHDQHEALSMSDRIALMVDGRLVQYDTPQAIFQHPASRAAADYFGEAGYLSGTVRDHVFLSPAARFPAKVPDGVYCAMFRPSAVSLAGEGPLFMVEECRYLGEFCGVVLSFPPTGETLKMTLPAPCKLLVGEQVPVKLDVSRAVLFPEEIRQESPTGKVRTEACQDA